MRISFDIPVEVQLIPPGRRTHRTAMGASREVFEVEELDSTSMRHVASFSPSILDNCPSGNVYCSADGRFYTPITLGEMVGDHMPCVFNNAANRHPLFEKIEQKWFLAIAHESDRTADGFFPPQVVAYFHLIGRNRVDSIEVPLLESLSGSALQGDIDGQIEEARARIERLCLVDGQFFQEIEEPRLRVILRSNFAQRLGNAFVQLDRPATSDADTIGYFPLSAEREARTYVRDRFGVDLTDCLPELQIYEPTAFTPIDGTRSLKSAAESLMKSFLSSHRIFSHDENAQKLMLLKLKPENLMLFQKLVAQMDKPETEEDFENLRETIETCLEKLSEFLQFQNEDILSRRLRALLSQWEEREIDLGFSAMKP